MANDNGGIIGIINTPTADTASGVWSLDSQYQAQTTGTWPPIPAIGLNSARFNKASGDYLNRTQGTPTSRRTFTYSGWIKISELDIYNILFESASGSHNFQMVIQNNSNGNDFRVYDYDGSTNLNLRTSQAFRDISAWYHIVLAVDTTQATDTNRLKLYVNGEQATSFSAITYPSQNYDTALNNGVPMQIGRQQSASDYFSGYMSDVNFVDGQALDPTSFGAFNTNGVWAPIIPTVSSYGTNGFRLKFENSANLGEDSSSNGNNFTVNNLTSVDQSGDYPVNNFATLNPLATSSLMALSNGNLTAVNSSASNNANSFSTFVPTKGKYYVEYKVTATGDTSPMLGIKQEYPDGFQLENGNEGAAGYSTAYEASIRNDGQRYQNNVTASWGGTSFTTGDIISIALDCDNGAGYIAKNGTYMNSGDPTSGASKTGAFVVWTQAQVNNFGQSFAVNNFNGGAVEANFGHPPYAVASGNADANGYGNFEYTVPSGYYSLCTKNLAEFG